MFPTVNFSRFPYKLLAIPFRQEIRPLFVILFFSDRVTCLMKKALESRKAG